VGLRTRERVGGKRGSARPRRGLGRRAGGRGTRVGEKGRARAGNRRGGWGRERRREGRGGELTSGIQLRRSPSLKPRAPRERQREMGEREKGCCAGEIK
jgi:hypothetical protein